MDNYNGWGPKPSWWGETAWPPKGKWPQEWWPDQLKGTNFPSSHEELLAQLLKIATEKLRAEPTPRNREILTALTAEWILGA